MCGKERLLELIRDFILFDGGIKKVPRVHQYFGVAAAQETVKALTGGIIWHTQGSGKSLVMVQLTKRILENKHDARVVVVTDRDELDKQIEAVLKAAGAVPEAEKVRATSTRDLATKPEQTTRGRPALRLRQQAPGPHQAALLRWNWVVGRGKETRYTMPVSDL